MSKQTAIEKLKIEANALLEMAQKIETMLPDLPEMVDVWATDRNLRLDLPFNWNLFRQVRRLLGIEWKSKYRHGDDDGCQYFVYIHHEHKTELVLTMKPYHPGSTCQRKQVGVKEVPVFEVVCN